MALPWGVNSILPDQSIERECNSQENSTESLHGAWSAIAALGESWFQYEHMVKIGNKHQ